jgi:AbrB family looped-hinge helix DNA binding protein
MEAVTISPKFQIVIPRKVRDSLKLKPGLKVQVLVYGNRIELIPMKKIIVPTVCIYEVFKAVLRQRGEDAALQTVALMKQGITINLSDDLALQAAKISLEYQIPMADSIILATARAHEAVLWTQDQDFKDMEGVNYFPK